MDKIKKRMRTIIQTLSLIIANFNIQGLFSGEIYGGKTKGLCVPGLNCYSCPAAGFSCPIGSLQQSLMRVKREVNTYTMGLVVLFGALFGRLICGYVCPFGFIQDLLYLIPTQKIKASLRYFRWVKYAILVVLVVGIPIVLSLSKGTGIPVFCKYICPQGTIAGLITVITRSEMARYVGNNFLFKILVLIIILALAIFIYRPFCRVICPLGAVYGLFNSFALIRLHFSSKACSKCGMCKEVCPVMIDPPKECNGTECIRCGKCVNICPSQAISFRKGKGIK